jgi:predicted dehydrogenase
MQLQLHEDPRHMGLPRGAISRVTKGPARPGNMLNRVAHVRRAVVKVGVAGYGMAGRQIHAPLVIAAGHEVAAISTSNPGRRAEATGDHPDAVLVDDLDALLGVPALDLVVLATPTGDHAAHVLAAVRAGVPVVVDKPLATTAEEAAHVVDAASEAGVPLTVFHNRRYDPEYATLEQVVRSGVLGEVRRAELRWERWRTQRREGWRGHADPAGGGGVLFDLGSHLVDGAVHLFGPVETVYAELSSVHSVADDDAFLACRHASGVVSHLGVSSVTAAPGPRTRVLGSEGAFLLNEFEGEPNLYADLAAPNGCAGWLYRGGDREPVPRVDSSQVAFYQRVAAALVADDPQAAMPVDPHDAVHTAAVLDAARRSAREGVVVRLTGGITGGAARSAPR